MKQICNENNNDKHGEHIISEISVMEFTANDNISENPGKDTVDDQQSHQDIPSRKASKEEPTNKNWQPFQYNFKEKIFIFYRMSDSYVMKCKMHIDPEDFRVQFN